MDFERISGILTIVSDSAQLLNVDRNGNFSTQSLQHAAVAATPVAHSSSFAGPRRTSVTDFGEFPPGVAELTMRKQIEQLVQLTKARSYALERASFIKMLDEALAMARTRAK